VLLEVLLELGRLVVADQPRIDPFGDDLGAEDPRGSGPDLLVEDQRYLVRPADIEMVADEALEKRPAGCGTVKDPGIGDLELAERQLIDIPGAQVLAGERRGQPALPAPEEAGDSTGPEPVADPLQQRRLSAGGKPVIQRGVADAGLGQLPLGPLVPVDPLRCRPDYAQGEVAARRERW
jgi:hypothetical protein